MPDSFDVKFKFAELPVTAEVLMFERVGGVVSITRALAPAILFAPEGRAVDVITLPAVSSTGLLIEYEETVRSLVLSLDPTV